MYSSQWETLAMSTHIFLLHCCLISYFANVTFPHLLLLLPMILPVTWKRAYVLPTVWKQHLYKNEGNQESCFIHPLSKLFPGQTLSWGWTSVQTRYRSDLFSLCLQAQGREKPSLYELELGDRGKGMHTEVTQSWAASEKQDTCQSS